MLSKILEAYPDEKFLVADGFDEALIGLDYSSHRLVYSISKCVKVLMSSDKLSYIEAREYLDYNTLCAFVGENTPIFVEDDDYE